MLRPQSQESENYSQPEQREAPPEQRSEIQEPTEQKIAALRQRYGDWDQVMSKVKNENIRISDQAAKVARSLEQVTSYIS
jgi:hypothetical protein